MVNEYTFLTRHVRLNKAYTFVVKSADINNALASLELQYESKVGSFSNCEIMQLTEFVGVNVKEPEYNVM